MSTTTNPAPSSVGPMLRQWRERRRLSQLALSVEAAVSARHLSFIENGKARPSREMILHLGLKLDIPLREQNRLLTAAGYSSAFSQGSLSDHEMEPVRDAISMVLGGHDPYPAFAVDRHWNIIDGNDAGQIFFEEVDPRHLVPPVNALRMSLSPDGMAPNIQNLREWRAHILLRLQHQIDATADPVLRQLLEELTALDPASSSLDASDDEPLTTSARVVVPLLFQHRGNVLSFFSTTTVFGTPLDVTVSEIAIEAFFPADPCTAASIRGLTNDGAHQPTG